MTLEPLSQPVQRAERVYEALLSGIVSGNLAFGAQLCAESIAEQLQVSTTPVRDALNRLEKDRLVIKLPYQGWFVRDFEEPEIKDLYELRAGLERFSVRLACQRITAEESEWLGRHQARGEAALERGDMEEYRVYNQELHAAIMRAARNSQLIQVMSQISLQVQALSAKTIRVFGRPPRAVQEHRRMIELIAGRDAQAAGELMECHILGALEDILRHDSR